MAERYSISNRKNANNKNHSASQKSSSKERLYDTSTLSSNTVVIIAAIILVVTNITTLTITSLVYRAQINHLNQEVKDLQNKLDLYKKSFGDIGNTSSDANKQTGLKTGIPIPANTQKSVQDALNAYIASGGKDPAVLNDLKSKLNSSLTFAIAGSSTTQQTLAQAIASLGYLSGANGTWNWNIPQSQLAQYQAGQYAQYFGDNAIVGQSSNGYVVSLTVDSNGNVTQIFVSSSVAAASVGAEGSE